MSLTKNNMTTSIKIQHPWKVSPKEAIQIQKEYAKRVITEDKLGKVRFVAGVDVGFENNNTITCAAIAVMHFPELELYEHAIARRPTSFPYIPGLLSFREIPAVLDAMHKLKQLPDLLLCDGQGIAHPRRLGIASHLGVLTGIPAIGVAKNRLIGTHDKLAQQKGCWVSLHDGHEVIGAVVRTRSNVKPLYISPGHKISLKTSIHIVMQCITKYRLPETTRWAHELASNSK